jgi:hypothetical protein
MIILIVASFPREWTCADEVAYMLQVCGFKCSAQQTAAWLQRISRKTFPPIERKPREGIIDVYRLTVGGENELEFAFPGLGVLPKRRRAQ